MSKQTPSKLKTQSTESGSVIRNVCVYCGSGKGTSPAFAAAAREFGRILAEHDLGLVYGGGGLGLMGEVARAALDAGGRVTGIIPEFLSTLELTLKDCTEIVYTKSMHERKREMYERSDAFVALPGGIGTLEEFVEQMTWQQIGQHRKPILLLNTEGYWQPLIELLAHMRHHNFIRRTLDISIAVVQQPREIIPALVAMQTRLVEASPIDLSRDVARDM